MDLRQLRHFLAIAREGGISAAARSLHMAQPPLSQQLKQLEEELDTTLVERGSRSIRLTENGELLKNRAEQILAMVDSVRREIKDSSAGATGTLVIGAVSSSGLPDKVVNTFHQQYPGIHFELHESNTYQVLDYLKTGRVEIGIVRTPFNSVDLSCLYADPEPMMAAYVGDNPFSAEPEISVADLQDKPLILYRRFELIVREACEEAGFDPLVYCISDDARTVLNWAKSGYGIAITPRSAMLRETALSGKIINHERLRTRLAAICMKNRYLSTTAKRFLSTYASIHRT